MGAVTHPNPDVEKEINDRFVPVQFNVVEQPEVMERYNIRGSRRFSNSEWAR